MSHVDEGTLHAYLDGELPSAERTAVEAHLVECATCRANLIEERALRERASALLGSALPVERPAPPWNSCGVNPSVRTGTYADPSHGRPRSPWRSGSATTCGAPLAGRLFPGVWAAGRCGSDRGPATEEDKALPPAAAPAPSHLYDRRAARPTDEVDSASKVATLSNAAAARETPPPTPAGAPAQRQADSLRLDARVASGAMARAEQPRSSSTVLRRGD